MSNFQGFFFKQPSFQSSVRWKRFCPNYGIYSLLSISGPLDKPSRFLFAIPVFFLLVNNKKYSDFIWYGVLGGSILAFLIALYERFILFMPRADGFHHPIMFGNTALLLGTISFVSACYFFNKNKPYFFIISILSGLSGISTSFLSGSRSGWAAIPLAFVFLFIFSKGLVSTKLRYSVLLILTALSIVFWNTPSLGVTNRINQGLDNFKAYFDGDTNTSIGLRLDMWTNAYNMFIDNPVFGIGYNGYQEKNDNLFHSGILSEELRQFNHAHSDYLNALAQQGIVGFIFLMLIYFVPLFNFISIVKNKSLAQSSRYFALAGALIPICYIGFGLSQTMFSHNIGVMLYAFFIVFFWVASNHSKK